MARARWMPPIDEAGLPASLNHRFANIAGIEAGLCSALSFVSPITTTSGGSNFFRDGP